MLIRTLRSTCIHEYAHLAVARRLGACGFVRIARVVAPPADDSWHGEFHLHGELDPSDRRIVALAGVVAEQFASNACRSIGSLLACLRERDRLSAADAMHAQGFDAHDVARCVEAVAAAWRDIEADADDRVAAVFANLPA